MRSSYVEKVTDKKLIESAINGMLQALDPHSSYLSAESFKEMRVNTSGKFGGLGIQVTTDKRHCEGDLADRRYACRQSRDQAPTI